MKTVFTAAIDEVRFRFQWMVLISLSLVACNGITQSENEGPSDTLCVRLTYTSELEGPDTIEVIGPAWNDPATKSGVNFLISRKSLAVSAFDSLLMKSIVITFADTTYVSGDRLSISRGPEAGVAVTFSIFDRQVVERTEFAMNDGFLTIQECDSSRQHLAGIFSGEAQSLRYDNTPDTSHHCTVSGGAFNVVIVPETGM